MFVRARRAHYICVCSRYIYICVCARARLGAWRPMCLFLSVCFAPRLLSRKPGLVAAAPASKTARWPAGRPAAIYTCCAGANVHADGHTASNAPDLFRPPKLSGAGPGQYWGGGPPGKTLGCCQLLLSAFDGRRAGQAASQVASKTASCNIASVLPEPVCSLTVIPRRVRRISSDLRS